MCVHTHGRIWGYLPTPKLAVADVCTFARTFALQVWLIALNMMLSSPTHFLDDDVISHSLWLRIKHHCVSMHNLYSFLHPFTFWWDLGCFHMLVPVASAAVNMECKYLWRAGLHSFGYTCRRAGAGSWPFYFQLFEKCHTHLHGSYTSLHLTSII